MLATFVRRLRFFEAIIATAAYAVVAGLLIADVVGRELFGGSMLGSQQLAVYGAIIAGFLGLTLATSDNSHLRPAFMDFLFKPFASTAERVGDGLSALFFLIAAYVAWTFIAQSMESQDKAPVLYFVVWPLQLVIPYAFLSCALKHFLFAWQPGLKPDPNEEVR